MAESMESRIFTGASANFNKGGLAVKVPERVKGREWQNYWNDQGNRSFFSLRLHYLTLCGA